MIDIVFILFWGLGIGDWGFGIWAKTQNPIPKTQYPKIF